MITIKVNGKTQKLDYPRTLAEFLETENMLAKGGMAVAVSGKLVRKDDWDKFLLQEGHDLIIINAAYGG